jgi:hypothetical protein
MNRLPLRTYHWPGRRQQVTLMLITLLSTTYPVFTCSRAEARRLPIQTENETPATRSLACAFLGGSMWWKAIFYAVALVLQIVAGLGLFWHSLFVDDYYTSLTQCGAAIAFVWVAGQFAEQLNKELDRIEAEELKKRNDRFTGRSF